LVTAAVLYQAYGSRYAEQRGTASVRQTFTTKELSKRTWPDDDGEERLWKITCFCTRPDFSGQGVTVVALRAALQAIAKKGGGVVGSYPIVLTKGDPATDERLARWYGTLDRLIKTHGRFSPETEEHLRNRPPVTEYVEGVGEVSVAYGRGPNLRTSQREGLKSYRSCRRSGARTCTRIDSRARSS
jgi:hypothetical protein